MSYPPSRRAFSKAAARTHVETLMLAASAARRSSPCSASVVSTRTSVARRSLAATGGRPVRTLPFFALDVMD